MKLNTTVALACALLAAPLALSQAPAGPNQPPMSHFGPRGEGQHGFGMGIAPYGRWWKNPATVTAVGLTTDQQKHLDDIFQQSRAQLIEMKASLEEEQLRLTPMLEGGTIDQANAYAEISKIADLRANLEKANAKMLLSLRAILTADQWTRLQAQRPFHHDGPEGFRNRRNPDNQMPPQGPGGGFD